MEQERVGHPAGAADAPADLVELRQTQEVGPLDDQGVGVGDVQTALDDGGGHQHVVVAAQEVQHHPLQLLLVHLAVGHAEAHRGHQLRQAGRRCGRWSPPGCAGRTTCPPRSISRSMARCDHALVVEPHVGLDGVPVARRRLDDRDVAHAGERHLQGAGDRGGRQGQHVDLQLQLAQRLLLGHAETLLLVDDDQAQVLRSARPARADGACRSARRPCPRANSLRMRRCSLARAEARDHLHFDRELGEALPERAVVLLGQDGRGHQHHAPACCP